jgi:energy-coupling factor transporter ATPase
MEMIKVEDLAFEYIRRNEEGEVESINRAIDGVSLDVKKGDFIAIIGANGSGKSTLAKHINAILYPSEGTVWVNGMNTLKEENLWEIRRSAGMVFQNPDNQIIASVIEEDVGFGPENLGVPTEEIWERVEESLQAVGMLEYRAQSPNKLSGGQKQRVAIAGIMAMRPECIVLDEPTAMLDPDGRKEVISTIHWLNQHENITVLLITHHMDEVINADKVFVMEHGKIVMQGTPREIFTKIPEIKKYRLDVPQVTELAYELKMAGVNIPDGILSADELVHALESLGE